MPERFVPPTRPVTVTFEDEAIVAQEGEPLAVSLVAAGHLSLARSPKFHRPRGPACLRAACDGCLARVDEVPNVMTCLLPAKAGTKVAAQNILGSKDIDLLRVTDWFFPSGLNHHELFAGVPGLQPVMQAFARRVAGLGRLPKTVTAARAAARRTADVVIVGAGPAGMLTALEAAKAGRRVEVIDEGLTPGGSIHALAGSTIEGFQGLLTRYDEAVKAGQVRHRARTLAGGFYGDDLLVVGDEGAEIVAAASLVLAVGAHDGALAFEGNDVPGVVSARAAGIFLRHGVALGKRVAVVVVPGGGPFGARFARAAEEMRAPMEVSLVEGTPLAVKGSGRVKSVTLQTATGVVTLDADALVVDAPRAPAHELPAQAGAHLEADAWGFALRLEAGRVRPGVFAVGECTGSRAAASFELKAFEAEAKALVAGL